MPEPSQNLVDSDRLGVYTKRQAAVLTAALDLLADSGERGLTTAGIARAANCSKESLYKWFGGRDDLLAAMVAFQAGKVGTLEAAAVPPGEASFRSHLAAFAHDLLSVLAGDVSVALNRLAIGQVRPDGTHLGHLVLIHGRRLIGIRAGALIEAGRAGGFIAYADRDEAFQTFYGLVVRDVHVRLLLGDTLSPAERDFSARAALAVDQFCRLYAAGTGPPHAVGRA